MARMSSQGVRERLLDAGVQTFSKSGFNGCSVQDITEAAGVPKGSFYNHFESKEALGAAALDHYWSDGGCEWLHILTRSDLPPVVPAAVERSEDETLPHERSWTPAAGIARGAQRRTLLPGRRTRTDSLPARALSARRIARVLGCIRRLRWRDSRSTRRTRSRQSGT